MVTAERAIAARALMRRRLEERARARPAIQTDDELHAWIKEVTGHDIPRAGACDGHDAPFDFIADLYFHRVSEALVLANRTGGKTEDTAALHLANGATKPPFETSHIGAIEAQAKRCYAYYLRGLRHTRLRRQAPSPHIRETTWLNGSRIEILPGTERQTQGGHPTLVAFDELESGTWQPYENAKLMSTERDGADGEVVGQFVALSTRVTALGLMQRALDEAQEAGTRVYTWCVYETMQPCTERCVRDGCRWLERSRGATLRARGWRSHAAIEAVWNRVTEDTWEAQMECRKPEAKALIYANFGPGNVTEKADYVAGGGPLLVGYDWGFTDPTHIALYQYRDGRWCWFDELTGTGRAERVWVRDLVKRICALPDYDGPDYERWERIWAGREGWPSPWPNVWPEIAAGDPSAVQLRAELREHGFGVKKPASVKHNVEEGQDVLRAAILAANDERRLLVHPRCGAGIAALSNYRARPLADGSFDARPDPDAANHAFSHGCDQARYLMWVERRKLGLMRMEADDDGTDETEPALQADGVDS